jgi:hypothetical protein
VTTITASAAISTEYRARPRLGGQSNRTAVYAPVSSPSNAASIRACLSSPAAPARDYRGPASRPPRRDRLPANRLRDRTCVAATISQSPLPRLRAGLPPCLGLSPTLLGRTRFRGHCRRCCPTAHQRPSKRQYLNCTAKLPMPQHIMHAMAQAARHSRPATNHVFHFPAPLDTSRSRCI